MAEHKTPNLHPAQKDRANGEDGKVLLPTVVTQEIVTAHSYVVTRPDPFFVTQLIATASHDPQTRTLRRASPEDAQTSYRSTAAKQNKPRRSPRAKGTSWVA